MTGIRCSPPVPVETEGFNDASQIVNPFQAKNAYCGGYSAYQVSPLQLMDGGERTPLGARRGYCSWERVLILFFRDLEFANPVRLFVEKSIRRQGIDVE